MKTVTTGMWESRIRNPISGTWTPWHPLDTEPPYFRVLAAIWPNGTFKIQVGEWLVQYRQHQS